MFPLIKKMTIIDPKIGKISWKVAKINGKKAFCVEDYGQGRRLLILLPYSKFRS